jgi:cysteine desulfurase/selenocysteine lyase
MKETLHKTIKHNTKILAISYVSNVLGTINPLKKIIQYAKQLNPKIVVIVDGCQAVPHMPIDVQDLGCDFFAFSAHKMLGPTGVGVLWGKLELLKEMFPFMMGGEMVAEVAFDHTEFKAPPHKFEAGTPNIADVIAIKEAISYIQRIGFEKIHEHEQELTEIAMKELYETFKDRIRIYGPKEPSDRAAILAFTLNDCHPHDIAQILDEENIAVRAGHHCAMPLHKRLNIPASTRLSMYMYNTHDDVFKFIERLKTAEKLLVK